MAKLTLSVAAIVVVGLLSYDFMQRIYVPQSSGNANWQAPLISPQAKPATQIKTKIARLVKTQNAQTAAPVKPATDKFDSKIFGDTQIALMGIYQKGQYTAVFSLTSQKNRPEYKHAIAGDSLGNVLVKQVTSRHVTLEYAGEAAVLRLFTPNSSVKEE